MVQKIEFIIDKVDGKIFLGQHGRTVYESNGKDG